MYNIIEIRKISGISGCDLFFHISKQKTCEDLKQFPRRRKKNERKKKHEISI